MSRGCAAEMPPLHPSCTGQKQKSMGVQWRICTFCCPPPHHCTGGCGEANMEREQERSAQTDMPEGAGAAISLPGTAVYGGATHPNCPQPLLYLQMCVMGGQDKLAPRLCTGHENVIMQEPLQKLPAAGLHSCRARGGWNQHRGAGCWLPAGSQPPLGWNRVLQGQAPWGPSGLLSEPLLRPWSPAGLQGS